jgi:peptide deformylase
MIKLANPSIVENIKCEKITLQNMDNLESFLNTACSMIKLCLDQGGVGLAAPQVGIPLMFFVAIDMETKEWNLYINPEYSKISDELYEVNEACLTYGIENKYKVKRYHKIISKWETIDPKELMLIEEQKMMFGLEAQIFQHETDHVGNGQLGKPTTIAMIGEKYEEVH